MLVSTRFQVLFHSPPGVLFTFPSRYCSSIGHQVVFRLGWWSTRFPTGFHVSRGTLDTQTVSLHLSDTGLSPSVAGLPMPFSLGSSDLDACPQPRRINPPVWPPPRSLATTSGISVDVFSSPYLDVSVQAVPFVHLFDSMHDTGVLLQWVSPFGNLTDQRIFAPPRSLSQLVTSFVGS